MAQKFIAACVQNCATPDVEADIAILAKLIDNAAAEGAELIALPEYCAGLDTKDGMLHPFAVPESDHPVLPAMAALARAHKAWILIGSIGVKSADGRILNRGYMLSPDGAVAARYDKIHMFDVDLGDGHVYRESATIMPGHEAVLAPCVGGLIGLSICYDLRFADLYRMLAKAGAQMLAVPAAFTRITGKAHWHILNRARAIENGAYVIAPCQYGTLAGGSECYGHSLIIDPWGRVLADGGEAENVVTAEIDLAEVAKTRARIPSLVHDRPFSIESVAPAVAAE
ncbi:MAG: carbon-nitrogen hydrolase family protein [Parvibaculaceae bacterium]